LRWRTAIGHRLEPHRGAIGMSTPWDALWPEDACDLRRGALTGPATWRAVRLDAGLLEIGFTDKPAASSVGRYRFTR
jgi:hypothetical protein